MKRIILTLLPFAVVLGVLLWAAHYADHHREEWKSQRLERVPPPPPGPEIVDPPEPTRDAPVLDDEAAEKILENENITRIAEITDQIDRGEMNPVEGAAEVIRQLNDPSAKALDPDILAAALPASVPGWKVIREKSGTSGFLAMKTTYAEKLFRRETAGSILVKVMDPGTMRGISGMMQDLTSAGDVSQSNEHGEVQTLQIGGHSAVLKYSAQRKKTTLLITVDRKILIMLDGRGIPPETVTEFVAHVNTQALEGLTETDETAP